MHTFRLEWDTLTLKQIKQMTHLSNITTITGTAITAAVNLSLIMDENILNEKHLRLFNRRKANG